MDFLSDYFYIILLIVGAIAQWLKSRSDSIEERRQGSEEQGYDPEDLEEFIGEAERRHPQPAVPPPLPPSGGASPVSGRSPFPDLKRKAPPSLVAAATNLDASDEWDRQQKLIDKAREFKRAKAARGSKEPKISGSQPVPKRIATGIRGRLHNRRELRSAFVLKEILEKPVGLR